MANYYEKIRVKTATEGTHKRTMKADTDTSIDFGQFLPIRTKILELGQGTIRPWTISNMMPLPQPTFGETIYENRIYAVPIHTIFKGYQDFREDAVHVTADNTSQNIGTLPYTKNDDIINSIMDGAATGSSGDFDFKVDDNGTIKYYKFTSKTLWWVKLLTNLGYRWIWRANYTTDQGGISKNVIRLLAVAKVYSDYYYNKAYRGDTDDILLRALFKRDNGNLYYNLTDLRTIKNTLYQVYYDMDYFTACWDRPDTPNTNNQASIYTIHDPNGNYTGYGASTDYGPQDNINNIDGKDPVIQASYTGQTYTGPQGTMPALNQWALNMLKSLTMFLKRNQLAGGDTLARFLARYGVMNDDLTRDRARLIGTQKWTMQVSPIFSTSDTASQGGEVLGSYAGQGFASSNHKDKYNKNDKEEFKYETNTDIVLVEILTVKPVEKYVDGEDRENLILTKTEMITPEFDNVGVDPVIAAELVMPREQGTLTDTNNIYTKIFGWLPRYAYMKTMKDVMSGNYTNPNFQQLYLPYTLIRRINDNQAPSAIAHSKSFTKMEDAAQYDRIFYGQPNDKIPFDNINIHHELEIEWWSYAKPLYDNYDWEHEGGKEIEIQNQGN